MDVPRREGRRYARLSREASKHLKQARIWSFVGIAIIALTVVHAAIAGAFNASHVVGLVMAGACAFTVNTHLQLQRDLNRMLSWQDDDHESP